MLRVENPSRWPVVLSILLCALAGSAIWYLVFRPDPEKPLPGTPSVTSSSSTEKTSDQSTAVDLASAWDDSAWVDESEVKEKTTGKNKKKLTRTRGPKPSVNRKRIRNANRLMMVLGPEHGLMPPPPPPAAAPTAAPGR
jgi:hypothetical protein